MTEHHLLTSIARDGQRFYDREIVIMPKRCYVSPIASGVSIMFHGRDATPRPLVVGHERIRLRWMRPDGFGGLVPKYDFCR